MRKMENPCPICYARPVVYPGARHCSCACWLLSLEIQNPQEEILPETPIPPTEIPPEEFPPEEPSCIPPENRLQMSLL
jgi:hypothetical protein